MADREQPQPTLAEQLRELSPPAWIEAIRRHGQEYGCYPLEDLSQLLGDPNKGVTAGLGALVPESFYEAGRK